VPDIHVAHVETPTSVTQLGARGVGEAGTVGAAAAIWTAVNDALAPLGATVTAQPITPEHVLGALRWRVVADVAILIRDARRRRSGKNGVPRTERQEHSIDQPGARASGGHAPSSRGRRRQSAARDRPPHAR
jgi:hypothetical protein